MGNLRFAARQLLKQPAFTVAAVVTLALGIGANTAIFSTLDAVLLRNPPFTEPGQLAVLWEQNHTQERPRDPVSAANFRDWQEQSRTFQGLAAWVHWGHTLTEQGDPQELETVRVSGSLFSILGTAPAIGRPILPEDEQPGRDRVVVLSHAFWAQHFCSRVLASLLVGVTPTDPITYAAVALLLAGVALLASYLPARRAARVDPLSLP